jgi:hypothetical protein
MKAAILAASLGHCMAILPPDGRMLVLSQFLGDLRSLALRPH